MLTNKEFSQKLEKRTKKFALEIIKLSTHLDRNAAGKVICYQVVKSGTSIGANYREANRSVSKADFRNKISICTKEASETFYWIELIREAGLLSIEMTEKIYKESDELRILLKIGNR